MNDLKCQAMSKQKASKFKPTKPTLLISVQDGDKSFLPFKERTNHITRSRYVDTLFCYFDDVEDSSQIFSFSKNDARQIINFLDRHFTKNDFENIIVHCQAGISRSQAIALFIAKYYYQDDELLTSLKNAPKPNGNQYVYRLLEEEYQEKERNK